MASSGSGPSDAFQLSKDVVKIEAVILSIRVL